MVCSNFATYICQTINTLTHKAMTNTVTTESICNEIETLINCPKFRSVCVEVAKKVGITAKEWNENKVNILYMFATKVVCNK